MNRGPAAKRRQCMPQTPAPADPKTIGEHMIKKRIEIRLEYRAKETQLDLRDQIFQGTQSSTATPVSPCFALRSRHSPPFLRMPRIANSSCMSLPRPLSPPRAYKTSTWNWSIIPPVASLTVRSPSILSPPAMNPNIIALNVFRTHTRHHNLQYRKSILFLFAEDSQFDSAN